MILKAKLLHVVSPPPSCLTSSDLSHLLLPVSPPASCPPSCLTSSFLSHLLLPVSPPPSDVCVAPGAGCSWLSWQRCWRWQGRGPAAASAVGRLTSTSPWRAAAGPGPSSPPYARGSVTTRYLNATHVHSHRFTCTLIQRPCVRTPPLPSRQDLVYISDTQTYEQEMCIGVWANEVKHIDGCPEGVTYPVAKNCNCEVCDPNKNTDCTRFTGKASSCLAI